ncbi:hypothetical protein Tco_1409150 [Tanacetum coccineum]
MKELEVNSGLSEVVIVNVAWSNTAKVEIKVFPSKLILLSEKECQFKVIIRRLYRQGSIEEVRMKTSQCEEGYFKEIEGDAKEYQIRNIGLIAPDVKDQGGTSSQAHEKLKMIYKSKFLRAESGVNGLERSKISIDN